MFMILLVDDTTFLLNLLVQSIGYHLHYFLQLGFHTYAVSIYLSVCMHIKACSYQLMIQSMGVTFAAF